MEMTWSYVEGITDDSLHVSQQAPRKISILMDRSAPGAGPQDSTPCTTFVQADAATFKDLVQRLTGPHDKPHHPWLPPRPGDAAAAQVGSSSKVAGIRRPTFKLQERRQPSRSKLTIVKPVPAADAGLPWRAPSPISSGHARSPLQSPSAELSNLLICEEGSPLGTGLNKEEEEKAIKERRFYLHPSPRSRMRNAEPELLPLFPVTSPTTGNPRMPPL